MQYILSVSEVNKYLKGIISKDVLLSNLWVRGEISNIKQHSSGHMYFTLKDENSLIKCVMFKSYAAGLAFLPENGMRVLVKGYVSVYERDGQYQLYSEEMQPDGIGALHVAFEQLKERLKDEGLFDEEIKKKIPLLPSSIGVVTSPTGSVIRDIINVLGRRYPNFSLKIFPVKVQGEDAAGQIAHAVKKFNELGNVDVIILARGGGSLEELWPFNEEIVARSIFESRIPVISAVGHETDYTIADFAADLRAPTPSAAAEIVMPEKRLLQEKIRDLDSRLRRSVIKIKDLNRLKMERLLNSIAFRRPFERLNQERMRLDAANRDLCKGMSNLKELHRNRAVLLIQKLNALSPLNVLTRGYGIIKEKETEKIIKSIDSIDDGKYIEIRLSDGAADCMVTGVKKRKLGGLKL